MSINARKNHLLLTVTLVVMILGLGLIATLKILHREESKEPQPLSALIAPQSTETVPTTQPTTTTTEPPTTTTTAAPVTTPTTVKRTTTTAARPATTLPNPEPEAVSEEGVWDRLAQCESSGNWKINTGNGYYGGLQMNMQFWHSYGGPEFAERPDLASREQQIVVAERARDSGRGYGPWPACSRKLGLR